MNPTRLIRSSLKNLVRFKMRSFFMSVGVAVGVATLIAGSSVGNGAAQKISAQIDQMFGPGTILIGSAELKLPDLAAVAEEMDQVVAFAPRLSLSPMAIDFMGTSEQAAVSGFSANADYVWNRSVIDGRYFSDRDVDRAERVALIGTKLKDALFADTDPIGEEIQIDSVPFVVVGVLDPMGIDPHGEDRDMDVYVPISTAQRRLVNSDIIGNGKLVVGNADNVEQDADQVAEILRNRFQIAEGQPDSFRIYTSQFAGKAAVKAKRMLGVYIIMAAIVVLLVAAVVISSIMLVVVRERISEIGLRKALGATRGSIATQFLFESTVVSLVAGVAGIALGLGVASFIATRYEIPMDLTILAVLLAVLASVVVGIISGIIPARRAASLDPVEALR
ncbi:MAG: ABC transporter permease [Gammaproteobacteria bacterium]|jgi:putative ABC transport system permease protein|nr:ABC transporter permease [Gammaproteobacteria bacterium]MDH3982935.1 ABC transporter permease [Gammaproteobacteria bacterium]